MHPRPPLLQLNQSRIHIWIKPRRKKENFKLYLATLPNCAVTRHTRQTYAVCTLIVATVFTMPRNYTLRV